MARQPPQVHVELVNPVTLKSKERFLQSIDYDTMLVVVIAIALTPFITYLTTSLCSTLVIRSSNQHKKAPMSPYWLPFVGSLIAWLWDASSLITKMVDKFGQSVPFGIRLGYFRLYILGNPDHVKIFFKSSARSLRPVGAERAMKAVFGTPDEIMPIYADDSGSLKKPLSESQVWPENRILYLHTKATQDFLAGRNGIKLGQRYMEILNRNIVDDISIGAEWVELSDLRLFIENLVFLAAVETFCGSAILSLNPTFTEDFWAFDRSVPILLKRVPRWLYPQAYENRDKMLKMVKKWHAYANEHNDLFRTGVGDPEWEPYWGCKYIKARQQFLRKIEVMNADGLASEDLGFLFAASGNSVRVVYWTIFEVFARPDLLSRVRDIAQSVHDTSLEESESFKLGNNPFLQSIFAEVTRLRVVGMLPRVVTSDDFKLGEWFIPRRSFLGVPSRTGAMNRDIWNTGAEENDHPLDKFWDERFLIYPDKPNSGPLRNQQKLRKESSSSSTTSGPASNEPIFSLDGLEGAYLPFGGGTKICPGRQFARQEVLSTLSKLVLKYDIELKMPHSDWEPKMDYNYFPMGTLPPAEKVPFRIRRRRS